MSSVLRRGTALCAVLLMALQAGAGMAAPVAPVMPDPATLQDETELYLAVILNGAEVGISAFMQRRDGIWARNSDLRRLGVRIPDGAGRLVRLADLQGVTADLDTARQEISLTVTAAMLSLPVTTRSSVSPEQAVVNTSPGALLNYSLYGSDEQDGSTRLNGFGELRAFRNNMAFSSTGLFRSDAADSRHNSTFVRMDTSLQFSSPETRTTLRLGDTLTAALPWSRSTRIGGIQYGTDNALQPYFSSAPLATFIGSATLPSEVELYVNGLRQYSGEVPPGPFQLTTAPSVTGAGDARVVLNNALGQTTTLTFPVYGAARHLLAAGISEWSSELGFVREDYGVESASYSHDPAASGTFRRGLTDNFTLGLQGEMTRGLVSTGIGGNWLPAPSAGVFSGAVSGSRYHNRQGYLYQTGYHWSDARFHFSAGGAFTTPDYRDTAALYGAPWPRESYQATLGYNFETVGDLSLGYTGLHMASQTWRYLTASWFRAFGPSLSAGLSLSRNMADPDDCSAFFSLSVSLGKKTSVTASWQRRQDGNRAFESITGSPATDGGFGYQASVARGSSASDYAGRASFLGRYGLAEVGASSFDGRHYGYGSVSGSLVMMGGQLFAARQINNGFAVVSTRGVPDVPVLLSNNPVGKTGADGMLLVTSLNAYQNNKISIDPMDLPADMYAGITDGYAVPSDRAGTLLTFDIVRRRSAVVILNDETGKPLAPGSEARLQGQQAEPAVVGFDGETYFTGTDRHNRVVVETPQGKCHVRFDLPEDATGIPRAGPFTCRRGAESP